MMSHEREENMSNYLSFLALQDGLAVRFSSSGLNYCIDGGGEWKELAPNTDTPRINQGQKVSFKGNLIPATGTSGIGVFSTSGNATCALQGNIMSLLYGDDFKGQTELTRTYIFYMLFSGCSHLIDASELKLPATTLTSYCYYYLFKDCVNLLKSPKLPALELADHCYQDFFSGCNRLEIFPDLPATNLKVGCYQGMFYRCYGLKTTPGLPATIAAAECYRSMFRYCSGIEALGHIALTKMASNCFRDAFYGATSLQEVPELFFTDLAEYCCYEMFGGCTSLTKVNKLPATSLAPYCYAKMFEKCSKLNYIKMLATNISASTNLLNWVSGVASSGTFVKNKDAVWTTTGASGVPSGWKIEYEQ